MYTLINRALSSVSHAGVVITTRQAHKQINMCDASHLFLINWFIPGVLSGYLVCQRGVSQNQNIEFDNFIIDT